MNGVCKSTFARGISHIISQRQWLPALWAKLQNKGEEKSFLWENRWNNKSLAASGGSWAAMPYIKVVKKNETIKTGLISKDASGEEKKDGEK